MAFDFTLTPEQERVRGLCRELAADFATRAARHDADRSVATENIDLLRDAGLFGVGIPSEFGGAGIGTVGWIAAAEELARGDASTALGFNMHVVATSATTERAAIPDDTKKRVAALAIEDGALMCAPLSEPASSSLLPSTFVPTVRAVREDGGYRLRGRKMFASYFEASEYAYFYAHPEDEPDPRAAIGMLLPTRQDGITVKDVWDTHGMRATASNQVDIDGAFVPDDLVLYRTGDFLSAFLIENAHRSFGGYTACYLGVGAGMVDWAAEHLGTRKGKGFAQEIGYHPTVSAAVGEAVVALESARLMLYRAAWQADAHGPSLETFHWFLRAKLAVGRAVQEIATRLTVAGGLNSLFKNQAYERMLRDAATAPIMPPNSLACGEMVGLLSMGLDPAQAPSLRPLEETLADPMAAAGTASAMRPTT
ncbi:acyl-CoA dehydrogenase family protein [Actinomadura sp. 9N407]|uniref:acyl-CoA dehydrogenase family protein n=1 Tax=Actinomadura sp. 9N407 TaxID=3375154 RepID=UPI00378D32A6